MTGRLVLMGKEHKRDGRRRVMPAVPILFLFHRKDLVTLICKSEIEEGLSYETKSTLCFVSRGGGKEDVAVATRRRRRGCCIMRFSYKIYVSVRKQYTIS